MINFFKRFKRLFYSEKKLILSEILVANQSILRELTAMRGDSKSKEVSIQQEVVQMSERIGKLTKMIYDMVGSLSQYFKIELEFMEREKDKVVKKPTDHDAIF